MDFLKTMGKQAILVGVIAVELFFVWPGATTLFFGGMAAGVIVGNLYDPVEKIAEKIIDKIPA
ncbi:MAG: hypothetical protein KAI84_20710 [Gammaproteobacteria bacterium]|nr:hypothetical protein [Gammaproteobacteria bacterium]